MAMDNLDSIKYSNDPIIEVVCEFRFIPGSEQPANIEGTLHQSLKDTFPKQGTLRFFEGQVVTPQGQIEQKLTITERAQFLSDDEIAFVQLSGNLLAINHLKPYPTWDEFLPLVTDTFNSYMRIAQPSGIQRIGLRYINRIELGEDAIILNDYFNLSPTYPVDLANNLASFLVALEILYEGSRDHMKIQFASASPETPSTLAALLDFDYALKQSDAIPLDKALEWLDQTAHRNIQAAFEASITDLLRARFSQE